MPTLNDLYLESNDALAGAELVDDLELELRRAFDRIKCTDQAELSPSELAERVELTIVISPDEFSV